MLVLSLVAESTFISVLQILFAGSCQKAAVMAAE
jgi:hypothetical protein